MKRWLAILLVLGGTLATTGMWPRTTIAARSSGGTNQTVWTAVREQLPTSVRVLRPAWLPARFRGAPLLQSLHHDALAAAAYQVGYRSTAGDVLLFALGPVNSARPDTRTRIRINGLEGWFETTSGWPAQAIVWQVGTAHYVVQAHGVSRAELSRIVANVVAVQPAR